jgi:hypothetical protein
LFSNILDLCSYSRARNEASKVCVCVRLGRIIRLYILIIWLLGREYKYWWRRKILKATIKLCSLSNLKQEIAVTILMNRNIYRGGV